MQRADAVGQRGLVFLRRIHPTGGRLTRLTVDVHDRCGGLNVALAQSRRVDGEHRHDRRARAFQRGGEAGDFGGDVVDAFAQQRILDALGRPGRFRIALHDRKLALQLVALLDGERELRFELLDVGTELVRGDGATAADRCQFAAQIGFGLARGFGVVAQLFDLVIALGECAALVAEF